MAKLRNNVLKSSIKTILNQKKEKKIKVSSVLSVFKIYSRYWSNGIGFAFEIVLKFSQIARIKSEQNQRDTWSHKHWGLKQPSV